MQMQAQQQRIIDEKHDISHELIPEDKIEKISKKLNKES